MRAHARSSSSRKRRGSVATSLPPVRAPRPGHRDPAKVPKPVPMSGCARCSSALWTTPHFQGRAPHGSSRRPDDRRLTQQSGLSRVRGRARHGARAGGSRRGRGALPPLPPPGFPGLAARPRGAWLVDASPDRCVRLHMPLGVCPHFSHCTKTDSVTGGQGPPYWPCLRRTLRPGPAPGRPGAAVGAAPSFRAAGRPALSPRAGPGTGPGRSLCCPVLLQLSTLPDGGGGVGACPHAVSHSTSPRAGTEGEMTSCSESSSFYNLPFSRPLSLLFSGPQGTRQAPEEARKF